MGDNPQRGLYRKYDVKRTDGSSGPGGKHEHCAHFVLDLEHDEFAIPALEAYRDAARASYPALARDIDAIIAAHRHQESVRCNCREACCPHSIGQAFARSASDTAHELMNKRKP